MARVSERVVPSDTGRFCETTSRVSLSQLSDVSLDVVVLSVSTKKSCRRYQIVTVT